MDINESINYNEISFTHPGYQEACRKLGFELTELSYQHVIDKNKEIQLKYGQSIKGQNLINNIEELR